jgi:hypothetical protein
MLRAVWTHRLDDRFIPRLIGIDRYCVNAFPPIARTVRAMKVQTSNLGVIQMNNRNQPQTVRATAPAEATAPTYLNVFTVEEFESNGKTQKKWTRIGAAFPHKEGLGFSIELKAFPIDGRLVVLPPDTDDSNSRNGK